MTVQDASATSTDAVVLTDAAAAKAKALLDQEGRDDTESRHKQHHELLAISNAVKPLDHAVDVILQLSSSRGVSASYRKSELRVGIC